MHVNGPQITHQLLAGVRAKGLEKPTQYSQPVPSQADRASACDTISNYPRQADLGHEGNIMFDDIAHFRINEMPRGRHSSISNSPATSTYSIRWLLAQPATVDHESGR